MIRTVRYGGAEGEMLRTECDPATGFPLRQIYQIAAAGDKADRLVELWDRDIYADD